MTATTVTARSSRPATETLSSPSVARQIAATNESSSTTLTPGLRGVSLLARTCDIRFVIGPGAQTANNATSHFIAVGERLDYSVPFTDARIGVIRAAGATIDGVLEVTELNA